MDRIKAYVVIGLAYIVACAAGWAVFLLLTTDDAGLYNIIFGLFIADITATIVIWIFGLIFKNSSFYDAYWSLIPWIIILGAMIRFSLFNVNNIIFLSVFGVWSFRLTLNWAYTCKNLKSEDWRYKDFRANNKPFIWHFINFIGINMVPTLVVFSGLIPAIVFIKSSPLRFAPAMLAGCAVILAGTALEFFADSAMHRFRKQSPDDKAVLDTGLWKYSRHSNYLGEILVWIGVYLITVSVLPGYWFLFAGAAAIISLFLFVSIPLAEKRQLSRRPDYQKYREKTSMLFILPRKR